MLFRVCVVRLGVGAFCKNTWKVEIKVFHRRESWTRDACGLGTSTLQVCGGLCDNAEWVRLENSKCDGIKLLSRWHPQQLHLYFGRPCRYPSSPGCPLPFSAVEVLLAVVVPLQPEQLSKHEPSAVA